MNKVFLLGNLTRDAEYRVAGNGAKTLRFDLATNFKFKDKEGNLQEKADFHRCVLFGDRAEKIAQFLTKGRKVFVEARLSYGKYEKDGVTHYSTDLIVNEVEFASTGSTKSVDQDANPGYPSDWDPPV